MRHHPLHLFAAPLLLSALFVFPAFAAGGNVSVSGPVGPADPGATMQKVETKWMQDKNGWRFLNPDSTFPESRWAEINGSWYHFNEFGYMQTGWIFTNDKWFYLSPTSGKQLNGWIQDKAKWYCLNYSDGALYQNTTTPDGFTVDQNGAWVQ